MEMFYLGGDLAVCSNPGGRFHGWMFKRHPDGQWVSIAKLDIAALPSTPLAEPAVFTPPQLQMGEAVHADVAHLLMVEYDMRQGSGASKCRNVAREILERLAASPPVTRPGPPDTTLYLQRDLVRAVVIAQLGEVPVLATAMLALLDKQQIVTAGELRERPV